MTKRNPIATARRNGAQQTKFFATKKGRGSYNRKGVNLSKFLALRVEK